MWSRQWLHSGLLECFFVGLADGITDFVTAFDFPFGSRYLYFLVITGYLLSANIADIWISFTFWPVLYFIDFNPGLYFCHFFFCMEVASAWISSSHIFSWVDLSLVDSFNDLDLDDLDDELNFVDLEHNDLGFLSILYILSPSLIRYRLRA